MIYTRNVKFVGLLSFIDCYLAVLVSCNSDELSLGEGEGVLRSTPHHGISGFNHMHSCMVLVQGVQNDLMDDRGKLKCFLKRQLPL